MEKLVAWIVKNWDEIPDSYKSSLKPSGSYSSSANVEGLKLEEHIVVLLVDRQKPSVERCYSFDEERIGVTKTGKIIWGFDSGCSCPSPWDDSYPKCYNVAKVWKEFELEAKNFDAGWLEEAKTRVEEIKKAVKQK